MEKRLKKYLKNGKFDNVSDTTTRVMSAIRGKNNRSTERILRMALVRAGIKGWTMHPNEITGRPDFFFKDAKLAVFVDGCYWHGCPKCGHIPKTRSDFWAAKIKKNRKRDSTNTRKLIAIGVTSIRVWEHQLKNKQEIEKIIGRIKRRPKTHEGSDKRKYR